MERNFVEKEKKSLGAFQRPALQRAAGGLTAGAGAAAPPLDCRGPPPPCAWLAKEAEGEHRALAARALHCCEVREGHACSTPAARVLRPCGLRRGSGSSRNGGR